MIIVCDLADGTAVKGLAARIIKSEADGGLGETIDILINCGGIQRRAPAENFLDQDWDEVLQVNLNTVFTLSRDIGRHMLESRASPLSGQGEPTRAATANFQHRGKIINVASLISYQGGITVPAYAAAKHGILGLTKALSNEWASKGINVNAIAPGSDPF